jgi:hypothetical protein
VKLKPDENLSKASNRSFSPFCGVFMPGGTPKPAALSQNWRSDRNNMVLAHIGGSAGGILDFCPKRRYFIKLRKRHVINV